MSFVRGFARYRSAIDPRTQIPPASLLPYRPQRARPYIYTEQEIERLLTAARSLRPVSGLRGWTYYALFGLLSVSGLRISEALNLKLTDLDLRNKSDQKANVQFFVSDIPHKFTEIGERFLGQKLGRVRRAAGF